MTKCLRRVSSGGCCGLLVVVIKNDVAFRSIRVMFRARKKKDWTIKQILTHDFYNNLEIKIYLKFFKHKCFTAVFTMWKHFLHFTGFVKCRAQENKLKKLVEC